MDIIVLTVHIFIHIKTCLLKPRRIPDELSFRLGILYLNAYLMTLSLPISDYGFKLSEDLSLQVCVPDPEFSGNLYAPPVPCPVGTTYRRSKG